MAATDMNDEARFTASLAEARAAVRTPTIPKAAQRQDALVALARATAILNRQLAQAAPAVAAGAEAVTARGVLLDDLDERLRQYLGTVEAVAGALQPYSYQITLGVPSGVSVGFTWRVDEAEA